MPQTLLSLLALAAAAFFTLGQKQASTHTVESIVLDEFEVAVAGALLHTTEFADSRAFDDATTPERLRVRLGLPQILTQTALDTLTLEDVVVPTALFIDPSRMGLSPSGVAARCNAVNQLASTNCDDVSDFNSRTPMSDAATWSDPTAWSDVTLETPNGDPLPVEVHVEVHYVEATAPDVIVNRRTNHKRVDVWARSPLLMAKYPTHAVQMHRVISFDPATALEYLKRTSCVVSDVQVASVWAAEASVTAAQSAAEVAHARVETAQTAAQNAVQTAQQREVGLVAANVAAAAANVAVTASWEEVTAAYAVYLQYVGEVEDARNNNQRKKAERKRDDAWEVVLARYEQYVQIRDAASASETAAQRAQEAVTDAWAAATSAQQNVQAEMAAAAAADRTLAMAVANLQLLTSCASSTPGGAPIYGPTLPVIASS